MKDLVKAYPHLIQEWDLGKNQGVSLSEGKLTPMKKFWWKCLNHGHSWESTFYNRSQGKGCPYCCNQRILPGFNDLASQLPHLAKEWHPTLNGELTPEHIGSGSGKKVWWQCEKGHEWETTIASRKNGSGCPYCQNRKLLTGFNDLATRFPQLANEWHPTKNEGVFPQNVLATGVYRAWWQCEKGHEWEATIVSRANGTGCPYCSGKKVGVGFNDLATIYPDLAAQWHPKKNGALTPEQVLFSSTKPIWWQCEKGHEWQAKVRDRLKDPHPSDCRFCKNREVWSGFNDLATLYPELAKEWHPTKNGMLMAQTVLAGSRQKAWWKGSCGHEWEASLVNRTQKQTKCPYCTNKKVLKGFNDLATTHPELAKEWHPTLNGELTPEQIVRGTLKKVWWRCRNEHVWQARVAHRAGDLVGKRLGTGCPVCAKKRIG